jgi:hypothetical protein
MSESVVRDELRPYEHRIHRVIDQAWADYLTTPFRHRFLFARTRANIVFDLIAGYLLEEFDEDPKVKIINKDETIKVMINDRVLFRIKKANESGLGSNVPTQAVMEFILQESLFAGILPEVVKVEICYFEDQVGAEIASVAVTARDCDSLLWSYEINRHEPGAVGAEIIDFPPLPGDDKPPEVTPRKTDLDEKTDDEG